MPRPFLFTLGYATFVVYGSLLPFEVRNIDAHHAWQSFLDIQYLELGPDKRQDFVANGLLYLPLAFLCAVTATVGTRVGSRVLAATAAFGVAQVVAVGIEFAQLFFAGRSVSLNDLVAEATGSLAGSALWIFFGGWLKRAWHSITVSATLTPATGLVLYVASYVAVALMPMDFLVSINEWKWKLERSPPDLFLDFSACRSVLHCLLKLPVIFVTSLPIGMLLGFKTRENLTRAALLQAISLGFLLGFVIELAQFATVSGRAEGGSILARVLACLSGALMARNNVLPLVLQYLSPRARTVVAVLTPAYIALLAVTNRWDLRTPLSLDAAWAKLEATRFLPFFYHYYSPESTAFISVLSAVAMYAPVGALVWAWQFARLDVPESKGFKASYVAATITAALIWAGRLLLNDQAFADPTNILIAGPSAMLALLIIERIIDIARARNPRSAGVETKRASWTDDSQSATKLVVGIGAATILVAVLILHPLAIAMTCICVAYTFALFIFPSLWLIALPCALPLLDFGDRSGWTLINELDLLVLNTIAVLALSRRARQSSLPLTGLTRFLIAMLAASYLISFARGFLPAMPLDHNALGDYLSSWNAVHIATGFFSVLFLFPFLGQTLTHDPRAIDRLILGVLLGLCGTGLAVVHERYLFTGIFDLSTDFRVAGPFSSMQVGGQHIDAYLAGTLPLTAWFFVRRASPSVRAFAFVTLILGFYTLIVTYTRWTYSAVPALTGVLLCAWGFSSHAARPVRALSISAVVGALMIGAVAMMATESSYFAHRLDRISTDAATRIEHWKETWIERQHDLATEMFGNGLGTYPRARWIWADEVDRSARVLFPASGALDFVRLVGGRTLYFDQRVNLDERGNYRLEVKARSDTGSTRLNLKVCEKTVMYSAQCVETHFNVVADDHWQWFAADLDIESVGAALSALGRIGRRPVFLSILSPTAGASMDLASISLRSPTGVEMLQNGRFEHGPDHWRITSDDHIAWHADNLAVHLLFEQGWFGLFAFAGLTLLALSLLLRSLRASRPEGAVLLTAIVGLLFVGLTESLLDAPRIAFLYYLLVFSVVSGYPGAVIKARHTRHETPG